MVEELNEREDTNIFNVDHLKEIKWIYHSTRHDKRYRSSKHSFFDRFYVHFPEENEAIENSRINLCLARLDYAYFQYKSDEQTFGPKYKLLTKKQLEQSLKKIQISAKKLQSEIKPLTKAGEEPQSSDHIFGALITGIAEKKLREIEKKQLGIFEDEVFSNFNKLESAVDWLIVTVQKYLQGEIEYDFLRDGKIRKRPETLLVQNYSRALTEFFDDSAGYGRGSYEDQNSAHGWRIKAISYLLSASGVFMATNQILDAITSQDRN